MIRPGELRERITVQVASQSTNALGEATFTWADGTSVWASVNGVSASEALANGQQDTTVTHRVRLRYLPTMTNRDRIKWRDRTLNIVSLLEYDHRSEHVAICEETQ